MIAIAELPPFISLLLGTLLALVLRGKLRALVMVMAPILGALHLWQLEPGTMLAWQFMHYELLPVRVDKLSLLFGYLFHLAALIAVIYSLHLKDTVQHVAGLAYATNAVGAVFAGDLLTLFVFWEGLALTSVWLIWARRSDYAVRTGLRYLMIQVLSGVLLLAGTIALYRAHGTLLFEHIGLGHTGLAYWGAWLILIAFGIKSAFPFLHNWVTDAYPEATPTGTVFLAAITTKVAVYALARGYAGTELLVWVGAAMACFPMLFALMVNDLRRVLAYSVINQVGFMVVGVGIGTTLAINGAVAHAFNDVIFKGLLMMAMGAVLHMTGRINGSDLGGLYKSMPVTTVLCLIGAAAISAVPLFNGFVSKSMVMAAAIKADFSAAWLLLLFASAGALLYVGIRVPYFAFFGKDAGIDTSEPPKNMLVAMSIAAALCLGIGLYPAALFSILPYEAVYWPYTSTHLLAQVQVLAFAALVFVWLYRKGWYPTPQPGITLDVEWFYRKAMPASARGLWQFGSNGMHYLRRALIEPAEQRLQRFFREDGPHSAFARSWPSGSMVLWVAVLLVSYLLIYYL